MKIQMHLPIQGRGGIGQPQRRLFPELGIKTDEQTTPLSKQ
jgi:hypothetical protein